MMKNAKFALVHPVLVVLLLAGCFQPGKPEPRGASEVQASPPISEEEFQSIEAQLSRPVFPREPIFEERWVDSFDATKLRIRIYRPQAPPHWRAPILLHMSPYYGLERVASDGLDAWLLEHFVPRGYAVVLNDVRGTGESGGCLEHTGRNEARDGYEVVEHLARLPWTNSRIGMIGISYDGEAQQATLTTSPPHLTTIVPLASIAGLYDHVYFDAVPYSTVGAVGAVSYATQGMVPPGPPVNPMGPSNPHSPILYVQRPGCHAENIRQRSDPRGDFGPYWAERELRWWIPQIQRTSVFFVHGLEDWNVKPIHIAGWFNELNVSKHAWLGQWRHDFPDQNSYRRDWSRHDWRFSVHRWFDHWLLDIDTGVLREPIVQVQDSLGRWRTEDSWPPRNVTRIAWFLGSDNRLAERCGGTETRVEYVDNGLSMESGRGDSEAWQSGPLPRDLHYAGVPVLELRAVLSSQVPGGPPVPGTHFVAHLVDVHPDGSQQIINRGYLDAQHRTTLNESRPVPNNQVIGFRIRFFPQDDVVPAGHRLKLQVGAVDDWVQPDGTQARISLALGGDKAARLLLPIMDDDGADFFVPGRTRG